MFKIYPSKLVYHFFYLQNMSLWRSFCYKDYNRVWVKIIGTLTKKEEIGIKKFKTIMQKQYRDLFDSVFNKGVLPDDKEVQEVFKITEKNFQKIWDSIKGNLPKAKNDLANLIEDHLEIIKKIINKLKIFYKTDKLGEITNIYIILLPNTVKSGGGKFVADNNIVLEGSIERFNKLRILEILLHEMIHLYFENFLEKELYPQFSKEIDYHILKEIVASSLIPKGYLSHQFLNMPINLSAKNIQLIRLSKNYIKSNKPIDDYFIKKCIEFYKKQGPTSLSWAT